LDLGANRGAFAKALTTLTNAKIICVEPFKEMYDLIPSMDRLTKINAAVSDKAGKYYLTLN
jgi:FkbM family methyltransferase